MSVKSENISAADWQLHSSPFKLARELISGILHHWPHQSQPVSLLLCGPSGNGKSHVVGGALQMVRSATSRPVFTIVHHLAFSLARRNADGSTALRKDIRRAISSVLPWINDGVSHTRDNNGDNDGVETETAAVVVILDHMEMFITATNDSMGLTHADPLATDCSRITTSQHPSLMTDVYGIIRGGDLFSEKEIQELRLGCILFVTLFSGAYDDVDHFAQRKLFDAYISLDTPIESERTAFFDARGVIPPLLCRAIAARSGGVTYRGLMEIAEHAESAMHDLGPDEMHQLSSPLCAATSAAVSSSDSHAEMLAAAISLRVIRAFTASDSTAAQEYRLSAGYVDIQETRWCDIAGLDAVKQTLQKLLLRHVKYHAVYRRFGVRPSTGLLLCGPPGTGKTMLARAMATELNASFIYLDLPQLIQAEVGESERRLREFFRIARERSPSVMFIDELQAAFGLQHDAQGKPTSSHEARLVSQFLRLLDMAQEDEESFTVFVGATNVRHMLNESLLRAGRLDTVVDIPLPDKEARHALVHNVVCGEWSTWTSSDSADAKGKLQQALVDVVVNDTIGYTGAELRHALNVFALQLLRSSDINGGGDNEAHASEAVPRIMRKVLLDAEMERLSTQARGFLQRALTHATRR